MTPSAQDLRHFLSAYPREHADDLLVLDEAVHDGQDLTAMVWQLAARGRHPVLLAPRVQGVDVAVKKSGGKALAVVTDLTGNEQLENLVNTTLKEFGKIDILVNNAARSFLRSLMDLREDGWDKVFNTNVKAVWLLSRLVARKMMEQKRGRIINITTVGAKKAELGMAAYGFSKAALEMLTRCMAREWAQFGIQVNAVGPGLTKTDFSKPIWSNPEVAKHVSASHSYGTAGRARGDRRFGSLPGRQRFPISR